MEFVLQIRHGERKILSAKKFTEITNALEENVNSFSVFFGNFMHNFNEKFDQLKANLTKNYFDIIVLTGSGNLENKNLEGYNDLIKNENGTIVYVTINDKIKIKEPLINVGNLGICQTFIKSKKTPWLLTTINNTLEPKEVISQLETYLEQCSNKEHHIIVGNLNIDSLDVTKGNCQNYLNTLVLPHVQKMGVNLTLVKYFSNQTLKKTIFLLSTLKI